MNRANSLQDVASNANSFGKKLYDFCREKDDSITLRSYFPVNLKLAASLLKWEVAEVDGTGFTVDNECTHGRCDPKTHTISVDLNLSDPVKRFTIAHELGHAVLHEEVMNLRITPSRRRVALDPEEKLIEKQADVFAANLLMPKWAVTRFLRECLGSETLAPHSSEGLRIFGTVSDSWKRASILADHSFEVDDGTHLSLSTFFGVSQPAMAWRLLELGRVT